MGENGEPRMVYGALPIPDELGVRVVTQNNQQGQVMAVVSEDMAGLEAGIQHIEAQLIGLLDDIAKRRAEAGDDSE